MNTPGSIAIKVAALVGGAVLGKLLARWFDDFLSRQAAEQADYDRSRYAQGLGPIVSEPPVEGQNIEHKQED